jgi:5'-nucleotidase
MKILVVNDDGIGASGIRALATFAKTLGEVTVVAPLVEQSAKSQGIDIHAPFEVKEVPFMEGVRAYTVASTPADCTRFGIIGLGEKFDIVFSGINDGYNVGKDIAYSGTVGAIYEACNLGVKAIAFSHARHAAPADLFKCLESAYNHVVENDLFALTPLYNINFPEGEPKGIRYTRQGGAYYSDAFEPMGGDLYRQVGEFIYEDSNDLSLDTDCVMHGYISIMPLTMERTDMGVFETLSRRANADQ